MTPGAPLQFCGALGSFQAAEILGIWEPAWLISLQVEGLWISLQLQNGPQLEDYTTGNTAASDL